MVNVVHSSLEVHNNCPLCFLIISLHTYNTNPVPDFFVVTKSSKIVSKKSSEIFRHVLVMVRPFAFITYNTKPVPDFFVLTKGSKIVAKRSSGIFGPVLEMVKTIESSLR